MDVTKTEKIAPEYWLNSQLSVARHHGGCVINGKKFIIDPVDNYLVREDIYKAELKNKKKKKVIAKAEKEAWKNMEMFENPLPLPL